MVLNRLNNPNLEINMVLRTHTFYKVYYEIYHMYNSDPTPIAKNAEINLPAVCYVSRPTSCKRGRLVMNYFNLFLPFIVTM